MQGKSARKYQEITLSSNQLSTRTRQPRLHVMPRHLRQHLLTRRYYAAIAPTQRHAHLLQRVLNELALVHLPALSSDARQPR